MLLKISLYPSQILQQILMNTLQIYSHEAFEFLYFYFCNI